ncbi:MAG: response regulator [Deltaproteobacteria bacterium]|nr:response regulator [Deltaproteobacteria bacterium]
MNMEKNTSVSILVVDDEESIRKMLSQVTRRAGYECHVASDGAEALKILESTPIDIMITDIHMPGMTGVELLKKAMTSYDIDAMVMTGFSQDYDYETIINAGASDFVPKPIGLTEMLIRIQRVVRERRLRFDRDRSKKELEETLSELETAHHELREAYLDTVRRLVIASEFKDEDTGDHIIRMSRYCILLAQKIGMSEQEIENIRYASPMHDIGKIGIPDSIMLKEGKLTADEFDAMKNHTLIGAKILSDAKAPVLKAAHEIALTHHEKWNGKGYPNGLAGADIPIAGRIVGIADTFDALTSQRPYKKPYPLEVALKILKKEREEQFDPEVVDVFLNSIDDVVAIKNEVSGPDSLNIADFAWSERDLADKTAAVIGGA